MMLKTRYMTFPSESLILGATMVYGAEESKRIRSERSRECCMSAVYILCEKIFAQIPEHSQHGNDYSVAKVMVITGGI